MSQVNNLSNLPKIAIFLPDLGGAGAQRVLFNLACGIAAKGYAVDIVLVKANGPYLADMPESISVIDLKASRAALSVVPLASYLRRVQPDAVLAGIHVNIIAIWAKLLSRVDTRVVVGEHNTISVEAQNASNRREKNRPLMINLFYRWADDIVAVSTGVADDLSETTNVDRERVKVIYNPVITPDLMRKVNLPLNDPWFLPDQPPVLLGVGRLTAQKDFSTLIDAFAKVRQQRATRLLILGEGNEKNALEAQIKALALDDDVRLHGFVENPYRYMAHAHTFVLSSRWEGLPTVLIEALYCGPRIVSTDCPSGPREILQNGRYGKLTPVGDSTALATAIVESLDNRIAPPPRESWAAYEMDHVVDRYLSVLLGRHREIE